MLAAYTCTRFFRHCSSYQVQPLAATLQCPVPFRQNMHPQVQRTYLNFLILFTGIPLPIPHRSSQRVVVHNACPPA